MYGVRYDPTEEILITIGASEGLDVAIRATIDPGDEVILHEPSYVSYRPAVIFAGGVPVGVPTTINEDFALDPVSYTHLRAHETVLDLVCRLLLEKKKK